MTYYILIFQNTHSAMTAESTIKQNEIRMTIMPTPTYITKSCGLSIKIEKQDIEKIKELISKGTLSIKGIFERNEQGYVPVDI